MYFFNSPHAHICSCLKRLPCILWVWVKRSNLISIKLVETPDYPIIPQKSITTIIIISITTRSEPIKTFRWRWRLEENGLSKTFLWNSTIKGGGSRLALYVEILYACWNVYCIVIAIHCAVIVIPTQTWDHNSGAARLFPHQLNIIQDTARQKDYVEDKGKVIMISHASKPTQTPPIHPGSHKAS